MITTLMVAGSIPSKEGSTGHDDHVMIEGWLQNKRSFFRKNAYSYIPVHFYWLLLGSHGMRATSSPEAVVWVPHCECGHVTLAALVLSWQTV
mmetsp:Transcript_74535/g.144325  ORF Transcript_74535/g.144325 Transcript_74535/m.144325 type:complete len:92 (+) Transcript_74535:731-1006(+)